MRKQNLVCVAKGYSNKNLKLKNNNLSPLLLLDHLKGSNSGCMYDLAQEELAF